MGIPVKAGRMFTPDDTRGHPGVMVVKNWQGLRQPSLARACSLFAGVRPPRKNPAWTGLEYNDVGIHEFITFCRLLDTEPFIAVNTGLGTVGSAARQIQYCNSPADSPMGKLRAKNGHPEPFEVKFWAVGNEMYGNWQLGHMSLEDYIKNTICFTVLSD